MSQEDFDTFETILAQCTAFLERAQPPKGKSGKSKYDPSTFAPGEGYVSGTGGQQHGHIVLVDEENGSVMGELEGFNIVEGIDVEPGSKRK